MAKSVKKSAAKKKVVKKAAAKKAGAKKPRKPSKSAGKDALFAHIDNAQVLYKGEWIPKYVHINLTSKK